MPYPPKFDHALCLRAAEATVVAIDAYNKPLKANEKAVGFTAFKTIHDKPEGKGTALGWIGEDGRGTTVIAFRGTKKARDVVTDFKGFKRATPKFYASIPTHQGFLDQYMTVAEGIRSDLASLKEAGKAKKILVCGHSMGGALATLCALDMRAEDHKDVHMYSFGAPKLLADEKAAKQYLNIVPNAFRVTDPEDPVPKLDFGCVHIEPVWTPAKTPGKDGFDAHEMANYLQLVKVGKGT
jgi:dienelactone hydrolase